MGTQILLHVLLLLANIGTLCLPTNPQDSGYSRNFQERVKIECGFTRYPTLCAQTLTESGLVDPNLDFMSILINKTVSEIKFHTSNFKILNSHFSSSQAKQAHMAIDYCHELMSMSIKRLNRAMNALHKSPAKHKSDIQTWLSGVITFQQACKDSVEDYAPSNVYMSEIFKKMDYLSELASNPLALANRISGKSSTTGRRLVEGFPRWVGAHERHLLQSTEIKPNVVVAKDGSGDFTTISAAIEAATGGRFVIHVKSGIYQENISTDKVGIMLLGDGKYSTIITASSSVGNGSSLRGSATFTITGDGFLARDIGFENTAGAAAQQAVALTVLSDHAVLYRCSVAGYQDTLYALVGHQFYRECDIYGTVDFIFGDAAAVFQSCTLVLRRPRSGGAYNVILANGRTDPSQTSGFSVHNCKITVGSDFAPVKDSYKSYLGRPWKQYSRAVVMQSDIDGAIAPQGWVEWTGADGSRYTTLYFAEYGNTGPGSGTSGRVNWPGFRVIGATEAVNFTVANFIGGNSWLPSTGVPFDSWLLSTGVPAVSHAPATHKLYLWVALIFNYWVFSLCF